MITVNKNFLFLYLNTGGGHIGSASAVARSLSDEFGDDVSIKLFNGFNKKQHLAKLFFETGYRFSMSVLPAMYSLTYDVTYRSPFWTMYYRTIVSKNTAKNLERELVNSDIDTIVSFHFALTYAAVRAIRKCKRKIKLVVIVTDPFTAHSLWFIDPKLKYVVFSETIKKEMIQVYGIQQENISIMPFLVNTKFLLKPTQSAINALKQKHGFPLDKKIVLLAGGGEGLPGALEIVTKCVQDKVDFSIAVVCGRNQTAKNALRVLKQFNPKYTIQVFGFVPFMDELLQICDCAVIKSGPASLIESWVSKKPVIISTYIHGQELGNMRFAVSTGCAWFIQKPASIVEKLKQLFTDKSYYDSVIENAANLQIDTDQKKLANYLRSFD